MLYPEAKSKPAFRMTAMLAALNSDNHELLQV